MTTSIRTGICWVNRAVLALCLWGSGITTVFAQNVSTAARDEVSWTNDIRPVVNTYCISCHSGDDPAAGFHLKTYQAVRKQTEAGDLLVRINDHDQPMPESGLMPKHVRRLFQVWAKTGFVKKGTSKGRAADQAMDYRDYKPPTIVPIDIRREGFELLQQMQGHWVGKMNLMGQPLLWFAFDFRAISPSHVHGIFEGGTMGNLFTSFFVTDFNGKRTIMARNGGILNGIYRTSYFVLDYVERTSEGDYYRLVDAIGGADIMYIELMFGADQIQFNSYTSRFGLTAPAKLHMTFEGQRMHPELAATAAREVEFPRNVVAWDFSKGLPQPNWDEDGAVYASASYMWEDASLDLAQLGKAAKDPWRIDQIPHLARLTVDVEDNTAIQKHKRLVYLSKEPLTDAEGRLQLQYGYLKTRLQNSLLSFPEIAAKQQQMVFTYLHPGQYYVTVIADVNGDGYASPGDISHRSIPVTVAPESKGTLRVRGITVRN